MSDVWDLTDKERGDHVLIALTPEECEALLDSIEDSRFRCPDQNRAKEEIRRCLRDQKGKTIAMHTCIECGYRGATRERHRGCWADHTHGDKWETTREDIDA